MSGSGSLGACTKIKKRRKCTILGEKIEKGNWIAWGRGWESKFLLHWSLSLRHQCGRRMGCLQTSQGFWKLSVVFANSGGSLKTSWGLYRPLGGLLKLLGLLCKLAEVFGFPETLQVLDVLYKQVLCKSGVSL